MHLPMPEGYQPRKCENKGCNEIATVPVMLSVTRGTTVIPYRALLCEGHAFIAMGQQPDSKAVKCPHCETLFTVKEPPKGGK